MKSKNNLQSYKHHDKKKSFVVRDFVFSRFETLYGLEHHTFNQIHLCIGHLLMFYYNYLSWTGQVPVTTMFFELLYGYLGGVGITVGCHRYWAHKTFKANIPLQILLMILQTIAAQWPIHKWCLDHRIHHKYTDTNSDPHNSKRGFWFSHMIWLVLPKHKDLKDKLQTFEMDDLENDPVVRFQCKYYYTLFHIFFFIVPISVFYVIWGMPLLYCIAANYRRFIVSHHITDTVNSFAHMWGSKPYDKTISSVDNPIVSLVAGEGWHNYHHAFPWDYKASEFPWKLNFSTWIIDVFAYFGWAWDLKTVSPQMLLRRRIRTGELSSGPLIYANKNSPLLDNDEDTQPNIVLPEEFLWGWDDKQMPEELRKATKISHSKERF